MGQIRLFTRLPLASAKPLFEALEAEFEEDGLPLAILEIDEAADIHEVSVYGEAEDEAAIRARLVSKAQALGLKAGIETEILPDIDWVAKSLEGLKPVRAGRFLVYGAHDRDQLQPGDIGIEIEAGLAFGTGHHGTTAGCLELIDVVVNEERPQAALDLGTGSAVLAVALAKLAHIPVLATDIDPVATEVAEANVRLNGVADLVTCETATGFDHVAIAGRAPFDLIVANILAGPLMELAPDMARNVKPGGSLILSGILDRQHDAVLAAYLTEGFRHIATLHRGEWVAMRFTR